MSITPTPSAPCDWGVTWDDVTARGCQSCKKITTAAAQAQILAAATSLCWEATNREYGVCTETIRPCLTCSCSNAPACGCWWYSRIDLDPGIDLGERSSPVQRIDYVKVNGATLVAGTDYLLDWNRWLYRLPQGELWPVCQDVAIVPAPLEIALGHGNPPPQDLLLNGLLPLCREMAAGDCGDPCSIDKKKIAAIQREGISFAMISKGEAWKDGLTGDDNIDAALIRSCHDHDHDSGMSDPLALIHPQASRLEIP